MWALCVMQQAKPEYLTSLTDSSVQKKLSGVYVPMIISVPVRVYPFPFYDEL